MNDTTDEINRKYRQMIDMQSPQKRWVMGREMFERSRKMIKAGLRVEDPDASPFEIERRLFLRLYGKELSKQTKEGYINCLRRKFS